MHRGRGRTGRRGRRRAACLCALLVPALLGCPRRPAGDAPDAGKALDSGETPTAQARTTGPPAPRIYEQAPGFAPDLPAPPDAPAAGSASYLPERFRSAFPWFGFVNRFHLADIDRAGLFIEFGTAGRFKYTLGDWAMGWTGDEVDGGVRFTWAVDDPEDGSPNVNHRLYFHLERSAEVRLRMRYRTAHRRVLSGNLNGQHGFRWVLSPGEWRIAETTLPAEALRAGENYLQLYHDRGPGDDRGGKRAYFRVDWMWFVTDPDEASEGPPAAAQWVQEIGLRTDSGGETIRPSLVVPLNTILSYFVEIPLGTLEAPTDPFIGLAYGIRRMSGQATAPATFEIGVTGDDGFRRIVWSRDVEAAQENLWLLGSTGSLGQYAGRVVRIDLSVRGRALPGLRAVWGAPTLFVSHTPQAVDRLAQTPRNVILLVIDSLRADHVAPYRTPERLDRLPWRDGDVHTPALEALAEAGVLFEQALAPDTWTVPSIATILTGLHPLTHRVRRVRDGMPADAVPLAEFLRKQGFRTAAFVGQAHVCGGAGFERGWDRFEQFVEQAKPTSADSILGEAARWIEANAGTPFFLYVHTTDPHAPYAPPDRFRVLYDPGAYAGPVQPDDTALLIERVRAGQMTLSPRDVVRLHALYRGEIAFHDEALGTFLEAIDRAGIAGETMVVVTSDHGEAFLEHGSVGHGGEPYQEEIHVPLIVRLPGLSGPRRVTLPVGLADIAPTVIDALNLGPAADGTGLALDGNSLLPLLLGHRTAGPAAAFAAPQTSGVAAVSGDHKLLMFGPTQSVLLSLRGDPFEHVPLDPEGKLDMDAAREQLRRCPMTVRHFRILLGQYLGTPDRRRWCDAAVAPLGARALAPSTARYEGRVLDWLRGLHYVH
jgi:arylsulfatase A-like enzyme